MSNQAKEKTMRRSIKYILIKTLIFLGVFSIFHFMYDFIPLLFFIGKESVWEHLKGGFFAATFISLFELFIWKYLYKFPLRPFFLTRISSVIAIPWILFILYYAVNSWTGKTDSTAIEMAVAFSVTLISAFLAYYIENKLLDLDNTVLLYIIFILFFLLVYLFIRFTYELPFYPLFEPVR